MRARALNVNDASGLYLASVLQSSNRVSSAHGFGFCVSVMEYQPWIFFPVEAFFVVSLGGKISHSITRSGPTPPPHLLMRVSS